MSVFATCKKGEHADCPRVLNSRYHIVCECPCHGGRPLPENPCRRCGGSGYYGPISVEGGKCFECGGAGSATPETGGKE